MCQPPLQGRKLQFPQHMHVAYQNDRIEMLIVNLKKFFQVSQGFNWRNNPFPSIGMLKFQKS